MPRIPCRYFVLCKVASNTKHSDFSAGQFVFTVVVGTDHCGHMLTLQCMYMRYMVST